MTKNAPSNKGQEHGFKAVALPKRPRLSEAEMADKAESFYQLMKLRRTVRDFSAKAVPQNIIEKAILTAGLAPNGANRQPWHFCVLGKGDIRKTLRIEAEREEEEFYQGRAGQDWLEVLKPLGTDSRKPFLEIAPWLIVVFGARFDHDETGKKIKNYYVPESVGIACGMLLTALHNAGLATLTHTPSPMGFLNKICKRPEQEKPYMIIVTGYPAKDATVPQEATRKKTLEEISSFL